MADTLIVERPVEAEKLVGTAEEFQARLKSEPGFYKKFQEKMEAGLVEYTDGKPKVEEPVPAPVIETKPEDEEIEVKVKKADLGKYKNVGEVYKAGEAKDKHIANLESQIKELQNKVVPTDTSALQAEVERLKKEKAELEARQVRVESVVASQLPSFDDLTNLSEDQLKDKVFEAETLVKLVKTANQTPAIAKQNAELQSALVEMKKQLAELKAEQEKAIDMTRKAAAAQVEAAKTEKTFASISELQSKYDDLRTVKPIRAIDSEWSKFTESLCIIAKAYDGESANRVVNAYLSGDAELKKVAEEHGIYPPEEVDKYMAIREILDIADKGRIGDTPLTLEQAYVHRQFNTGGFNKVLSSAKVEEAKRIEAAADKRKEFAQTMKPADVDPLPNSAIDPDEAKFLQIYERNTRNGKTLSQVKRDPVEKALYDKFYMQLMGVTINWEKF